MKLTTSLFFWEALLLLTSINRKLDSGPITVPICKIGVSADSVRTYCTEPNDYNSHVLGCDPGQYCGINRVTGEFQACVSADQCPDNGDTAKTKTIVCSDTKPSCCCRTKWDGVSKIDRYNQCNNLKNPHDDTQWRQGCSLPELKNFPYCQTNPTSTVFCHYEDRGNIYNINCGVKSYCGIDKTSGELKQCRRSTDCPDSATDSREIVCEPGKPYCCCQVHFPRGEQPVGPTCHNFKEDPSIWKQACGLKELQDLDVCKRGPPTTTTTTTTTATTVTITEETTVTTGKTEVPTTAAPEVTKAEGFMSKDTSERGVVIAVIVIVVIIVLLVGGGLTYYYFFKKCAARTTANSSHVHGPSNTGSQINSPQSGTASAK